MPACLAMMAVGCSDCGEPPAPVLAEIQFVGDRTSLEIELRPAQSVESGELTCVAGGYGFGYDLQLGDLRAAAETSLGRLGAPGSGITAEFTGVASIPDVVYVELDDPEAALDVCITVYPDPLLFDFPGAAPDYLIVDELRSRARYPSRPADDPAGLREWNDQDTSRRYMDLTNLIEHPCASAVHLADVGGPVDLSTCRRNARIALEVTVRAPGADPRCPHTAP